MIIALVGRKGGGGKTTVAVNLADALAQRDRAVVLLDADPQASASTWLSSWQGFQVVTPPPPDHFDVLIIDTPGELGAIVQGAVELADLVIIPVRPSSLDIQAAGQTIRFCDRLGKHAAVRLLITQKVVGTVMARQARAALAGAGVPVCATELTHRIAHVESAAAGVPLRHYDPTNPAVQEFMALAEEIYGQTTTHQADRSLQSAAAGEPAYGSSAAR